MKNKILMPALLTLMMISGSTLFAQHNHGGSGNSGGSSHQHEVDLSPNGGELKEMGKYNVEMVSNLFQKKDKLSFYLFKSNQKPLSIEGVSGTITIIYKDGTQTTEDLEARGDSHFVAQAKSSAAFKCTVTFIIKGKTYSEVYTQPGFKLDAHDAHYTCPMHPSVSEHKPGNCPICGMDLEKK